MRVARGGAPCHRSGVKRWRFEVTDYVAARPELSRRTLFVYGPTRARALRIVVDFVDRSEGRFVLFSRPALDHAAWETSVTESFYQPETRKG